MAADRFHGTIIRCVAGFVQLHTKRKYQNLAVRA